MGNWQSHLKLAEALGVLQMEPFQEKFEGSFVRFPGFRSEILKSFQRSFQLGASGLLLTVSVLNG